MKRAFLVAIIFLAGVSAVQADFKDGVAAYKKGDFEAAFSEFMVLAEGGSARAQHTLGYMYEQGKGVEQDLVSAVTWYRKAAEQGDPTAQFNLAIMYYNGSGVLRNYTEAAELFRKAAEQGNARALYNLGEVCRQGHGVLRDLSQAYMWYALAAISGDTLAAKARDKMAKQMRPGQLERAEAMADKWLQEHRQ